MSVIDEIKERLDIVELVSNYVPLKKAGRSYKGLCPFHTEKTPSFVVFPETQGWHCFGACNTGGDIFSFVMKRENLDFGEALALLAARTGVELKPRTEQASAEVQRLERLAAVVADAAIYFQNLLKNSGEAALARAYLERRGLTPQTWDEWQLGYAAESWDALRNRLTGKGYTLDEIEEAGLVIRREDGSGAYDRFRGRLMFPIRDTQGQAIGFGARILREDPERPQPKYINSPQTPLFDKGSVLYGLDMARQHIREADLAVIVEGYMDVLMSHQVGVKNVVAGMGTALGEAQMRQLKRYSSNVTLALDPDAAGNHATLRGIETARQTLEREWQPVLSPTGLVRQESRLKAQLRIATLPGGMDPDELARSDVERWRQIIAAATPIVDYYLALVSHEEDLASARGKANTVERLAALIREIANPVERQHYIQMLARMIQADERLVAEQVAALGRGAREARPQAAEARLPTTPQASTGAAADPSEAAGSSATPAPRSSAAASDQRSLLGLEEHLLGCLLSRPELLAGLDADLIGQHAPPLGPDDFLAAEQRAIVAALQTALPEDDEWRPDYALAQVPAFVRERWQVVLAKVQRNPLLTDEKLIKDLGDSLLRLRARNLAAQIKQLESLIRETEAGGREQLRQYQELMISYTAQKQHIQKLLHARSLTGALEHAQAERHAQDGMRG